MLRADSTFGFSIRTGLAALAIATSTQAFAQSAGGGGGGGGSGGGSGGESSVTSAPYQVVPGYVPKKRREHLIEVDMSKFKLVPIATIDDDPPSMPPSTAVMGPTTTPSINVPAARTSVHIESPNCTVRDMTLRYC